MLTGPRRQRGVATVEWQVVASFALLPLLLGLVQLSLLLAGAAQLDYVAFAAARAGAMSGGDDAAIRRAATRALVPQLARYDTPVTSRNAGTVVAAAAASATAETAAFVAVSTDRPAPDLLRVRVTYCHPLRVPFVAGWLLPLLRRLDAMHGRCYVADRAPLVSVAVLPMAPAVPRDL